MYNLSPLWIDRNSIECYIYAVNDYPNSCQDIKQKRYKSLEKMSSFPIDQYPHRTVGGIWLHSSLPQVRNHNVCTINVSSLLVYMKDIFNKSFNDKMRSSADGNQGNVSWKPVLLSSRAESFCQISIFNTI